MANGSARTPAHCTPKQQGAVLSLPVLADSKPRASNAWQGGHDRIKHSRTGRWRALVLLLVHVAIAVHILLWLRTGRTISPVEPSESMMTLREGVVNAGFVFFLLSILSTLVLGRFFCGWACHIVALQDACAWIMMKLGVKPKPFRARLLMLVPLGLAFYMFVWPVVHREILRPLFMDSRGRLPWFMGQSDPIPGITTEFIVEEFWATFAPWYVAIPFILICTFGVVYFLGAKGFCTYGCPYGGFFAPADLFAVGKIRVTDACNQCGHCTAVCTSNVRVHEEVRDFKAVVDPGCMKCLDCVSVCPNEALYFGFGAPTLLTRPRTESARQRRAQARALRRARFDLSLPEEIAVLALFLLLFNCYRGMLNEVAMLMAVGMALIVTFCAWKLWRMRPVSLGGTPNIRLQSLQLRYRGRWTTPGRVLAAATALALAFAAWGGYVRAHLLTAEVVYSSLDTPLGAALRPEFQATPAESAAARRAIALYGRGDALSRGGHGWSITPDQQLNLAYMHVLLGDLDAADRWMRHVIDTGKPRDSLIAQAADIIRTRAVRANGYRRLSPEQVAAIDAQVAALHEQALARRPELDGTRLFLALRALNRDAVPPPPDAGPGQRPTYSEASIAAARSMWTEPASLKHPRFATFTSMARLELAIGGADLPARVQPLLARAAKVMKHDDSDQRLALAGLHLQIAEPDRAAELAREAAASRRRTGAAEIAAAGLFAQLGRADQAGTLLDSGLARVRELGPSSGRVGAMVSAAGVLVRLGRSPEATALFTEAAQIVRAGRDPSGRAWDLYNIAQAMWNIGMQSNNAAMVHASVPVFEQVRDLAPDIATFRFDLAQRYANFQRINDVERELIAAATVADRNAFLARAVSELLASRGKVQESMQWESIARKRESEAAPPPPAAAAPAPSPGRP